MVVLFIKEITDFWLLPSIFSSIKTTIVMFFYKTKKKLLSYIMRKKKGLSFRSRKRRTQSLLTFEPAYHNSFLVGLYFFFYFFLFFYFLTVEPLTMAHPDSRMHTEKYFRNLIKSN